MKRKRFLSIFLALLLIASPMGVLADPFSADQ